MELNQYLLGVELQCRFVPDRGTDPALHLTEWTAALFHDESEDGEDRTVLATADLYTFDWGAAVEAGVRPWEVLDAHSADTDAYSCIFKGSDLDPEFIEAHEGAWSSSCLTILDRVRVVPEWRGRKLGPLLAAMALQQIGRGSGVVVCYPAPFELDENERETSAWDEQLARLEQMWGRFGFSKWRNGVWVLDLSYTTLDKTAAGLLASLE